MKSFKPVSLGQDSTIEFILDDDSVVTHTIANLPIEDKESFVEACERYGKALERGTKTKVRVAVKEVSSMKGKVQLIAKEVKETLEIKK